MFNIYYMFNIYFSADSVPELYPGNQEEADTEQTKFRE